MATDKRFRGTIKLDVRDSTPDWGPYTPPTAPEESPNVLLVLYDDTGLAAWSPYGGGIQMPTMQRLADGGLTYSQWHTTALCSPTRSCLLTGRNHHTNGFACITEGAIGFPGANARLPESCAPFAKILQRSGWNTYWVGKNHNVPAEEVHAGAPKRNWPLAQGFDRFYGFLGGDTSQWYPELVYDNHQVEPPRSPAEGYHLTEDLADHAISFIADAKQVAPDKPFFLHFCPGATHAPHHVAKEWADRYAGRFDEGWDAYRREVFARQKELGVIPADAELSRHDPDVPEWETLSPDARRLATRLMEVYAGFLSHTDAQIGRLLEFLRETGELDNTLIMVISDNGASAEGGVTGTTNETQFFNNAPESLEDSLAAQQLRMDNYGRARQNAEFVRLELDRIEAVALERLDEDRRAGDDHRRTIRIHLRQGAALVDAHRREPL